MEKKLKPKQSSKSADIQSFTIDSITIDEAKLLRIHGYRELKRIRPKVRAAAAAAARETEGTIEPILYFRTLLVQSCGSGALELDDGTIFNNEGFDRFLADVRQVVVFILTMGHSLDRRVKTHIADDQLLSALFLETAGWLGIEAATKQFSIYLRSLAKKQEYRLSQRLGPGYSYKLNGRSVIWPLEQQRTIFELFNNHMMDIELLESCVMLPKISRSGIFGYLPDVKSLE